LPAPRSNNFLVTGDQRLEKVLRCGTVACQKDTLTGGNFRGGGFGADPALMPIHKVNLSI
jgi:hypothetical protein